MLTDAADAPQQFPDEVTEVWRPHRFAAPPAGACRSAQEARQVAWSIVEDHVPLLRDMSTLSARGAVDVPPTRGLTSDLFTFANAFTPPLSTVPASFAKLRSLAAGRAVKIMNQARAAAKAKAAIGGAESAAGAPGATDSVDEACVERAVWGAYRAAYTHVALLDALTEAKHSAIVQLRDIREDGAYGAVLELAQAAVRRRGGGGARTDATAWLRTHRVQQALKLLPAMLQPMAPATGKAAAAAASCAWWRDLPPAVEAKCADLRAAAATRMPAPKRSAALSALGKTTQAAAATTDDAAVADTAVADTAADDTAAAAGAAATTAAPAIATSPSTADAPAAGDDDFLSVSVGREQPLDAPMRSFLNGDDPVSTAESAAAAAAAAAATSAASLAAATAAKVKALAAKAGAIAKVEAVVAKQTGAAAAAADAAKETIATAGRDAAAGSGGGGSQEGQRGSKEPAEPAEPGWARVGRARASKVRTRLAAQAAAARRFVRRWRAWHAASGGTGGSAANNLLRNGDFSALGKQPPGAAAQQSKVLPVLSDGGAAAGGAAANAAVGGGFSSLGGWRVGGCDGSNIDPEVDDWAAAGGGAAAAGAAVGSLASGAGVLTVGDGDGCVLRVLAAGRVGSATPLTKAWQSLQNGANGAGLRLGASRALEFAARLEAVQPPPLRSDAPDGGTAKAFIALPLGGSAVPDAGFGVFVEGIASLQYAPAGGEVGRPGEPAAGARNDGNGGDGAAYVLEWWERRLATSGFLTLEVSLAPAEWGDDCAKDVGARECAARVGTVVAPSHFVAGGSRWTKMAAAFVAPAPTAAERARQAASPKKAPKKAAAARAARPYALRFTASTTSVGAAYGGDVGSALSDCGPGRACKGGGGAVLLGGVLLRRARTAAEAREAAVAAMRRAATGSDAAFLASEAFRGEAVEFYDDADAKRGSSGMPVCKDAFGPSYPCGQGGDSSGRGGAGATDVGCSFIRGSDRSTVYLLTRTPPAAAAATEAVATAAAAEQAAMTAEGLGRSERRSLVGSVVAKFNALCDWNKLQPKFCNKGWETMGGGGSRKPGGDGCNRAMSRWYHGETIVTQAMYALTFPHGSGGGNLHSYDAAVPHTVGYQRTVTCNGEPPRAWLRPRSEALSEVFGGVTMDTIGLTPQTSYKSFADMAQRRWREKTAVDLAAEQKLDPDDRNTCCGPEPCRAPTSAVVTSYVPDADGPCERWGAGLTRAVLFQMLFTLTAMKDAMLMAQMDASVSHFRFSRDAAGARAWGRWLRARRAQRRAMAASAAAPPKMRSAAAPAPPAEYVPPLALWRYQQLNRTYWLPAHAARGYTMLQFDYNYVRYYGHANFAAGASPSAHDCDALPYCANMWECSDSADAQWCFEQQRTNHEHNVDSGEYKPGAGFPSRNFLLFADADHVEHQVRVATHCRRPALPLVPFPP